MSNPFMLASRKGETTDDGTHKACVRLVDGTEHVVAGTQVQRAAVRA